MVADLDDKVQVWKRSLRPLDPGVLDAKRKPRPAWNVSRKWNSPSEVTHREGGSLWTARKMPARPPRPSTPPPPKEPTPPPTPSPEPEPEPEIEPIPWRDRYQFEPLGATLGRTNVIESAIRQIKDENITAIGHYPRDGVVNDHFAEWRSASRMSDATFTVANSSSGRGSRSRSKSPGLVSVPGNPGLFSKATVSSRARQRASVDYTFGQYQWAQEDTHSTIASPRPQPDWERRPSQAFSDDSKMSSFKSFKSSTASTESTNIHDKKRRSSFKKSSTLLNGPMPLWLDSTEPSRGC